MKQSLQLKLGQHLTMTPQLQQAIRLLQLSTLELQHEIQEALDSNPLLEAIESDTTDVAVAGAGAGTADAAADPDTGPAISEAESDVAEHVAGETIPTELAIDTDWEDIYETAGPAPAGSEHNSDFESYTPSATSLTDHLLWQLNLTPMSDTDRAIALALIDAIDADGMLTAEIGEITDGLGLPELLEADEVIAVLRRIQHFDPPGVGARDLRECLLLQLMQLDGDDPALQLARTIVDRHIQLLAARDYATLMRRLRVGEPELKAAIRLILQLNPRPGSALGSTAPEYVVPDVLVARRNGRWTVGTHLLQMAAEALGAVFAYFAIVLPLFGNLLSLVPALGSIPYFEWAPWAVLISALANTLVSGGIKLFRMTTARRPPTQPQL